MSDPTRFLNSPGQDEAKGAEDLLPQVYDALRRLAAQKMANEAPGQTLQPTALVHEAWLRLAGKGGVKWDSQAHFFAAAAEGMRRILIENARRKRALRHGGGQARVNLSKVEIASELKDDELLAVDEALEKLAAQDPARARLVKLRYFAGLTLEETAQVLGLSVPTAKRRWTYARAWLYREITGGSRAGP